MLNVRIFIEYKEMLNKNIVFFSEVCVYHYPIRLFYSKVNLMKYFDCCT